MAERVLVTGGAGFIGLHLCRRLLADGHDVVVLDNLSRHGPDPEFRHLRSDIRFVDHDLAQAPPPPGIGRCETVFHLAAWVGVGRVQSAPTRVLLENIAATALLLEWCAGTDVATFFLASTSEVADGAVATGLSELPVPSEVPFVIETPGRPRSSYALSKMVSESLLLFATTGARVRIGRYFNVYGPRMGSAHVIPEFIERVRQRVDPFPVRGGPETRAFCHVSDAVEGTLRLAALPDDGPVLANIGNDDEEVSMIDLAGRLFEMSGFHPVLDVGPAPAGSPRRRRPDLSVLRSRTGYRPAVPLDIGLRDTYAWYTQRAPVGSE